MLFASPLFPRDGLSRQPRHPPALLAHLIPDWQHPPAAVPAERSRWEDADGGMKVTLPWNPRPGRWSSAQLSSWAFREVFPLPRVRGLRGNINIFLAAALPQAGMQQLNSSIPFIKSSPLAPFSPRSPHMVPGVVFQDVPFE